MRAKSTEARSPALRIARRSSLKAIAGAFAGLMLPNMAGAEPSGRLPFDQWIVEFGAKATAHGITEETYARVMRGLHPDPTGLDAIRSQPEFTEQLWQYLNRRVSDWRVITGKQKANDYDTLLGRIERDFGVERGVILAVWGIESSYGDPVVQERYMRPVIPSLATLAWAEAHRRAYWEQELINALTIVQNSWSTPAEMVGSWAGAMGHTQWMPEVWLHLGIDYDHDGKVSPFGSPDDALATTARFFVDRGKYQRGEHWGYEVRLPTAVGHSHTSQSYAEWKKFGAVRADGERLPDTKTKARLWIPVPGGPAFLLGPNFTAIHSYNPSMNYTLALLHLGDRIMGRGEFVQKFPGSERTPTLAEMQEIQRRLTARGFDTGGTDGRAGNGTMVAVRNFQRQNAIDPADGYAGVGLLARLREGS